MKKSSELNHAFLHSLPIEIWLHGEIIGEGLIQRHTKDDVVVKGMNYLKMIYEFRIQTKAPV